MGHDFGADGDGRRSTPARSIAFLTRVRGGPRGSGDGVHGLAPLVAAPDVVGVGAGNKIRATSADQQDVSVSLLAAVAATFVLGALWVALRFGRNPVGFMRRHPAATAVALAAVAVVGLAGWRAWTDTSWSRDRSEAIDFQSSCANVHIQAFGTNWDGEIPASIYSRGAGVQYLSLSGVIHRVSKNSATFTTGDGVRISFRRNARGFHNADCQIG